MPYTFEILGISPALNFFTHQQKLTQHQAQHPQAHRAEYVAAYHCALDPFLQAVEVVSPHRSWNLDQVIKTVIAYWMHHAETVMHWRDRLNDAAEGSLIVARVGDVISIQREFELLLND